ncbi:MAG: hypothetical protein HKN26_07350 [Acidimicrobiales bacterium]|nr:hypothetical protein [Acidimicrobiales bacterium]
MARFAALAQAAQRHFVSARTVDNHLHKVYRRLALAGRADLRALFAPVVPAAG